MPKYIEVTHQGERKCLAHWAKHAGVKYQTLLARLRKGWSFQQAISTPPQPMGVASRTHGRSGTKEHVAWLAMKRRCSDHRRHNAHRYIGRGITVCSEWQHDFEAFLSHVGPAPTARHSLGRIDNNRGYEPGNVRWETATQQARNRG
ncbi:hypothetical protein ETAA8_45690 [Anatilimnocola aggregata]|uniref:Uncharacterized protein n=1 Tax=Anatilimnocola aggregata TaxID=2528021 RepID=A0A517YGX4_9BACT|nr:hypothetical protein ETAA8_45690 [Anatilimnocola aggregata]